MNEVNYKDYAIYEFEKYPAKFTEDWLIDIINTRHYYEVWYQEEIIACGGVSRDYSQLNDCISSIHLFLKNGSVFFRYLFHGNPGLQMTVK